MLRQCPGTPQRVSQEQFSPELAETDHLALKAVDLLFGQNGSTVPHDAVNLTGRSYDVRVVRRLG